MMQTLTPRTNRKAVEGFTLIEILVVIAIIAILAAILFPVFAKVREKARQITCLSNEKQIGLAAMQYTEDYDELMVPVTAGSGSWDVLINPYIKGVSGWGNPVGWLACPDDSTHPAGDGAARSYSMNTGPNNNGPGLYNTGASLAAVQDPAGTIYFAERPSSGNSPTFFSCADIGRPSTVLTAPWLSGQARDYPTNNANGTPPHNGGWNYIFCDGHAKWLLPQNTIGKGDANCTNPTMQWPCGMWTLDAND